MRQFIATLIIAITGQILLSCSSAFAIELSYFDSYTIASTEPGSRDDKWADYLCNHLRKRTTLPSLFSREIAGKGEAIKIKTHLDASLDCTYEIKRERTEIELIAKNEDAMLWLVYQFISAAAEEDERIKPDDLPPASIMLDDQKGTWPFEFRAIYSPGNSDGEMLPIKAAHHVDYNWGLWGHNIRKVLDNSAPEEVFALVDGKRDTTQYCFSSMRLHSAIVAWIDDQWGAEGQRFTIMPNDNKKVCECTACKIKGNTKENATPAVADMLQKLARRYPKHQFFMTSYHTTTQPPKAKLPSNAGVMLSTMAIPMRYVFDQSGGYRKFNDLLTAWKQVTPLVYVWEYDRNFDDYLSPFPCLNVLQKRLQYYRDNGITGISINDSGYDYASFGDMQTFVLTALMLNPDAEIEPLVRRYYKKYFPECGEYIADYYLSLEKKVQETNHVLPYYGTIEEEQESYLDAKEFEKFWKELDKKSKNVTGKERQLINQMLTAFCYTRLMLKPSEAEKEEILLMLKDFSSVPGLKNYKETDGSIEELLKKHQ